MYIRLLRLLAVARLVAVSNLLLLRFTVGNALVDIVMLVHDQAAWADLAIRAVENHTRNAYRLIIVDNASVEEKTKDMLAAAERRGHTVVRLPENKSFSNGVNAGVAAGDSKFIIILNDDAIVTEGWEGALMQDCVDKYTGMSGARSNFVSGVQSDPTFTGEPPYLIFVCVALRRDVWNTVGPMDEVVFDGFSCEDLDYSWRVQKAGYKLKVSSAFVLHAGSRTLASVHGAGAYEGSMRQRNDQKYQARLMDKWGKDFVTQKSKIQQRGMVTTYHAEEWTRVEFMKSLMGLRRSDGVSFEYLQVSRAPIHMARQVAADYVTDQGFDWWVQLDDDATFPSDVLRRLLSHQKDIVCALAYQRKVPHGTCAFELGPDGMLGASLEGIEHTGLRRVDVSGFHCSIMRTSVIKKMREAGIKQYFGGFDNKVGEDFAFPVAPETPVLGADFRWRPIVDFKPGDTVVGFDEVSAPHTSRRFTPATVTRLIEKVLPRVRIVTDEDEIVTTGEHPWLSNNSLALAPSRRWDWRPGAALKPGMMLASITPVVDNPDLSSEDYAAGYVQGLLQSDGTKSEKCVRDHSYASYVVRMKDTAPLERMATMLAQLGIESYRGAVRHDGNPNHAPMHKLGVQKQAAARKLDRVYTVTAMPSKAFAAGYLAGMYDGDGSHHGGTAFIHNTVNWKKDRLEEAARALGMRFTARDDRHVRICGQDNIFKFWQATTPSLTRRMSLLGQMPNATRARGGKEVKHRPVVIRAVEALPPSEVFCLTTDSSTFVANGLASHNCLNAKKIGVQIHCDTELISGHIGASIVVDEAYKQRWIANGRPS